MNQRITEPCLMTRIERARALKQRARVIWLYGRPAAGKTTLASSLERRLAASGYTTALLDGDRLRAGLNAGLGFSDADRAENLRRAAEVAKLFSEAGLVTLCAFITPLAVHREIVRQIIGPEDLIEVFVSADLATCVKRDPKGMYGKASSDRLALFTGVGSRFEPPTAAESPFVIDSEREDVAESVDRLFAHVVPSISTQE